VERGRGRERTKQKKAGSLFDWKFRIGEEKGRAALTTSSFIFRNRKRRGRGGKRMSLKD